MLEILRNIQNKSTYNNVNINKMLSSTQKGETKFDVLTLNRAYHTVTLMSLTFEFKDGTL